YILHCLKNTGTHAHDFLKIAILLIFKTSIYYEKSSRVVFSLIHQVIRGISFSPVEDLDGYEAFNSFLLNDSKLHAWSKSKGMGRIFIKPKLFFWPILEYVRVFKSCSLSCGSKHFNNIKEWIKKSLESTLWFNTLICHGCLIYGLMSPMKHLYYFMHIFCTGSNVYMDQKIAPFVVQYIYFFENRITIGTLDPQKASIKLFNLFKNCVERVFTDICSTEHQRFFLLFLHKDFPIQFHMFLWLNILSNKILLDAIDLPLPYEKFIHEDANLDLSILQLKVFALFLEKRENRALKLIIKFNMNTSVKTLIIQSSWLDPSNKKIYKRLYSKAKS
ncbi:hypothetical protein MXB_3973, partial [Myxobolus squamalis]